MKIGWKPEGSQRRRRKGGEERKRRWRKGGKKGGRGEKERDPVTGTSEIEGRREDFEERKE